MLTDITWPMAMFRPPDDCVVRSGLALHVLQRVVEIVEEPEHQQWRLRLGERIRPDEVGPDTLVITSASPHVVGFRPHK